MIENIRKIVAVLNDFEHAESVLAKAFFLAKAHEAIVEVIYVHEVPLFALPDYFVLDVHKGKETLNKAQVRKEIRQKIATLEYDKECTLFTYISDTPSRVAHCVKEERDTLIITAYHDKISQALLKSISQPILFVKSPQLPYQDIVLNVTLSGRSPACVDAVKTLFSEARLTLLYDYRYIVDPSMELDIQNLAIIEESQRKSFEFLIHKSGVEGVFFVDGSFEGKALGRYIETNHFDLLVICMRKSHFFGVNPLAMELLEDPDNHTDVLVQSEREKEATLADIKEAVIQSETIDKEEKTLAVQKIEAWYNEDRGMELLSQQLVKISSNIRPLLAEMGLL